jgi:uncharacterized membrane protein
MADPTSPSQPAAPAPPPAPQSDPDIESGKVLAILCYIPVAFVGLVVSIVCIVQKNNAFSLYHAKQSLTLTIAVVVLSVVWCIPILNMLLGLAILVLYILGLVNAASGKYAPVPLVGQFADKIFGSITVEKK